MNILEEIKTILAPLGVPLETGIFTNPAPETYLTVTPLIDSYALHADNKPQIDVQEARISIYSKSNYQQLKKQIIVAFLNADYTITLRQYIGYETDTGYYHYNIDVSTYYETEE